MSRHPGGLNEDFRDMLASLLDEGAEFVVVGATKDIDIFVRPTPENAPRVHAALVRFGAPLDLHGVVVDDFASPGVVYQLGLPPRRIDITSTIDGVEFDAAWAGRVEQEVEGLSIPFLGPGELARNKTAVGRPRDRIDLELMREAGLEVDAT